PLLDMVGVVGSSPIAPTKQNPLCWAVKKGSAERLTLFCFCSVRMEQKFHVFRELLQKRI
ncbi:hypothetical protein, partial [Pseudomonas syringae]|uniref:hypothetical protein n=1 Tax=Pseudomonas syringae TaxID=317 RepID=UPI001E56DA1F